MLADVSCPNTKRLSVVSTIKQPKLSAISCYFFFVGSFETVDKVEARESARMTI